MFRNLFQCQSSISSRTYIVAETAKQISQNFNDLGIVINNQNVHTTLAPVIIHCSPYQRLSANHHIQTTSKVVRQKIYTLVNHVKSDHYPHTSKGEYLDLTPQDELNQAAYKTNTVAYNQTGLLSSKISK